MTSPEMRWEAKPMTDPLGSSATIVRPSRTPIAGKYEHLRVGEEVPAIILI